MMHIKNFLLVLFITLILLTGCSSDQDESSTDSNDDDVSDDDSDNDDDTLTDDDTTDDDTQGDDDTGSDDDDSTGPPDMILIPAGEFGMGCTGPENPLCSEQYEYIYVEEFYIDRYEISFKQFKECVDDGGCDKNVQLDESPGIPAQSLSLETAQQYCSWAGKRLPTSAEWEKAARGTEGGHTYPWGDEWQPTWANWCDGTDCDGSVDGFEFAAPVDAFPENVSPYGVQNMCGNMLEWTSTPNPDAGENYYIVRGGSYRPNNGMGDPDGALISWFVSSDQATVNPDHLGARCAY